MRQGEIELTWANEDGEGMIVIFPSMNEVCPNCEGFGTHLTESIREHAYSQEEFAEAFDDDESRQAYFQRGGMYDVQCETCGGEKVIPVVRESAFNEWQKVLYADYKKCKRQQDRYDAESRAEREAERRMGC